ncbi:MAG: hypothetical protein COY40_04975 [Alphaproteobacteria bacterium CG_4_10_14_0_8_um_filter_53_9]|nr:MAG: hypothetical protein COY40_04975 [Alphaproteobacteria bacterium CG_4_10_14_0_8_um_filter_53_9]
MRIKLKRRLNHPRHRPSKAFRKRFVLLWVGKFEGESFDSILLPGFYGTRISISGNGRVWKRWQDVIAERKV